MRPTTHTQPNATIRLVTLNDGHSTIREGARMTAYRDRLLAGHYDPVPSSPDETTLAELKQQAEARGLPTYGTKADLIERLQNADTPAAADDQD